MPRRKIKTPNGDIDTTYCQHCTDETVCSVCGSKADWLRNLNRRVLLWCRATGRDPLSIRRAHFDDEVVRVDGLSWTIVYSEWIGREWDAWAKGLGFTRCRFGEVTRARTALRSGHTADEFDAWLDVQHPLEAVCACGCQFDLKAWEALPFVGMQPLADGRHAQLRNCSCGSTMMVGEPS